MDKIYGYKEKDVVGLAEFIKDKGNRTLVSLFKEYGAKNNKSKGTVRNLYYAIAKRSLTDGEFCKNYLDGKSFDVEKIEHFDTEQERELIKKIILGRANGRSIRGAIRALAMGDERVALRYQNKFRNVLKNKKALIKEIVLELQENGVKISLDLIIKPKKEKIKTAQKKKNSQIDNCFGKTAMHFVKEHQKMAKKIKFLEEENRRLKKILYGNARLEYRTPSTGDISPATIIH